MEFRLVGLGDAKTLTEIFTDIDETFFRPHPFTPSEALKIANHAGSDVYALLLEDGRPVAYGMLRGWDEGYVTPSLGIAVRTASHRQGFGRLMMAHLHAEARRHGATTVRLRVHPDNRPARHLYETIGYRYAGLDRDELVMLLDLDGGPRARTAPQFARGGLNVALLNVASPECIAFLNEASHDFYHLPAYVSLCADEEGGIARMLYVEGSGGRLLLPIILRPIPGTGRHDATSPYGYPGPLVHGTDDPGFLASALEAGLVALRDEGAVSVFVRFHPLLSAHPPQGLGEVTLHGITVGIDLTLPAPALWDQTRRNHRRDILRAVRSGFVVRVDSQFDQLDAFKDLYRATMHRRGAAPYYYFADRYWDRLRAALGDRLHLLLVVDEGEQVASAGLFVETDGIVQYHLMGSDGRDSHAGPSKLLIHFARSWAKQRGNRHLHLGGGVGGAEDSLLNFKSGFSPLRHPFYTLRTVLDEAEYDRLVELRDPSMDPRDCSGFFPAYRRP